MLIRRLAERIRRREGYTTAAAASGATVLCMNAQEADRVKREHGYAAGI